MDYHQFARLTLKTLLLLAGAQLLLGCTVTTNGETRTYSIEDILNTVDQTLSGRKVPIEQPDYGYSGEGQPLLAGASAVLVPQAQHLDWERLLFAQMQLHPSFDFNEHADAYMQIFRPTVWKKYRDDEFELAGKRRDTVTMMRQSAASFNPKDMFLVQTSFKFGNYDFNRQIFPLDSLSESSVYTYQKRYSYTFPSEYKVGFSNASIIGDLNMSETDAKVFLQKRKSRSGYVERKVYAKLFFSNIRLDGIGNDFIADLNSVYLYSDKDQRLLLAKYSSNPGL